MKPDIKASVMIECGGDDDLESRWAVTAWPEAVWVLLIPLIAAALAWPAKTLWNVFVRRSDREDRREDAAIALVELLRRALDKGRVRETGMSSACELLIVVIDLLTLELEEVSRTMPPPASKALARALDHLKTARATCLEIERGGKP